MPSDPDDDTVTELILGDDHPRRGWRRRAVGMPQAQALAQIPLVGTFITQIPIEPLRILQRHIRDHDLNQARWVRHAIVERYLREGGNPDVAAAALHMRRNAERRRDVPRDQAGQRRDRQGRKQ